MKLTNVESIKELNDYINNSDIFKHVYFDENNNKVKMLDQLLLPFEEVYLDLNTAEEVGDSIKRMNVRGGGSIAVSAAYGLLLSAKNGADLNELIEAGEYIKKTRPTASSLAWIVNKIIDKAKEDYSIEVIEKEVVKYIRNKLISAKKTAEHGAELINDGDTILTHCHAGAIAGAGFGGITFGVFKTAHKQGKNITVYSTETRPYLQGARITTWELKKQNIPTVLITDNMAGHFIQNDEIDLIIVGADRIAKNGDVANKVGTYLISLAAKESKVPVYVGASDGNVDFNCKNGKEIPIEMRDSKEVTHLGDKRIATPGIEAKYPAFDITPNKYITGFIYKKGIIKAPFEKNLKKYIK